MSLNTLLCRCCSAGCDCGCVEDCGLLAHREAAAQRTHTDHGIAAQERLDLRDETAQRLGRLTSDERARALAWLAMQEPDVLNTPLDETEAQR